jgi:hypothetical protein
MGIGCFLFSTFDRKKYDFHNENFFLTLVVQAASIRLDIVTFTCPR